MYLTYLSMRNFRNYEKLDLELSPGLQLFHGVNAQGKSNLLEAVHLLAITRSHRATTDIDVIRLEAMDFDPYTRIIGVVNRQDGNQSRIQVDMALSLPESDAHPRKSSGPLRKQIRLDGTPCLASEAIGVINSVLFSAEDISIVFGPPSGRRRSLDLFLARLDRSYIALLRDYQRILIQRNHLLRRIGAGNADRAELFFWNQQLCSLGATIIQQRHQEISSLSRFAFDIYRNLSKAREALSINYLSTVDVDGDEKAVETKFHKLLEIGQDKEVQMGQTLVGPHRDEVLFRVNGRAITRFGSRGQARSVALGLRLAELQLLKERLGEEPILLLDDAISEMDEWRQESLMDMVDGVQQTLMTVIGTGVYSLLDRRKASGYHVTGGSIFPIDVPTVGA